MIRAGLRGGRWLAPNFRHSKRHENDSTVNFGKIDMIQISLVIPIQIYPNQKQENSSYNHQTNTDGLFLIFSAIFSLLYDMLYFLSAISTTTYLSNQPFLMASLLFPPPAPTSQANLVIAAFCDRYPNPKLTNWLECFDPETNSWDHIGQIPDSMDNQLLNGFAMVSLQGFVFIIGGRLCERKSKDGYGNDPDDITEQEIAVLSSVWRFSVSTKEWSRCASLDVPRFDFACTVSENKIYVAGGKSTVGSTIGLVSSEMYDPLYDNWTRLPDMSTARHKCAGVTWQRKVHVVGGFVDASSIIFSPARSSAEVLDTTSGKWIQVGMWRLDVPPNQIVPINGNLFSSGDCLHAWKGFIDVYNEKLNIWNAVDGSNLQLLSSPRSTTNSLDHRLYVTMAPIKTHLYFFAGFKMQGEASRSMSVVNRFDTSAIEDPWTSFDPVEEEGEKILCSHCCVVQV